jgi:hypothetical protein
MEDGAGFWESDFSLSVMFMGSNGKPASPVMHECCTANTTLRLRTGLSLWYTARPGNARPTPFPRTKGDHAAQKL